MPTVFFEYSTIATLAAHLDPDGPRCCWRAILRRKPCRCRTGSVPAGADQGAVIAIRLPRAGKHIVSPEMAVRYRDIAIIGMDGLFPEAQSVEDFWQAIRSGKDLIKEIPEDHWDIPPLV